MWYLNVLLDLSCRVFYTTKQCWNLSVLHRWVSMLLCFILPNNPIRFHILRCCGFVDWCSKRLIITDYFCVHVLFTYHTRICSRCCQLGEWCPKWHPLVWFICYFSNLCKMLSIAGQVFQMTPSGISSVLFFSTFRVYTRCCRLGDWCSKRGVLSYNYNHLLWCSFSCTFRMLVISVLMPTSGRVLSVYPPYLIFVAVYKWSGLVSPSGIVSSVVVVIFSAF